MRKTKANSQAFTLVELLVVISIIALLLAILMPSLQKAREQAKRVICLSQMGQIALGCNTYINDFGCIPPSSNSNDGLGTYKVYSAGDWGSIAVIYRTRHIPDFRMFWCPSSKGIYSAKYNLHNPLWYFVKSPSGNYQVVNRTGIVLRSSYQYRGKFLGKERKKGTETSRLAILMDLFVPDDRIPWHKSGYNIAFIDGSASFYSDKEKKLTYTFDHPTTAPGYSTWGSLYGLARNWLGTRAVWAVLDTSH